VVQGSLPDLLGLRSGDELLSVNGFQIANPSEALLAYARLRHADHLQLAIERAGKRTEIHYFIR
jgi:general secretion pathway protein C